MKRKKGKVIKTNQWVSFLYKCSNIITRWQFSCLQVIMVSVYLFSNFIIEIHWDVMYTIYNSNSHMHLSFTFNSNGKWKDHYNEIYTKAWKRINILRLIKHNIDRKSLAKLYIWFIRPILEYGWIVWDNCSIQVSDLLESVQLEAALIITGLRKGTSHN